MVLTTVCARGHYRGEIEYFAQLSMSEYVVPEFYWFVVLHHFDKSDLVVDNKEDSIIFVQTFKLVSEN